MRYVIVVCVVTGLLVWDAASNDGRYLTYIVLELRRLMSMIGV